MQEKRQPTTSAARGLAQRMAGVAFEVCSGASVRSRMLLERGRASHQCLSNLPGAAHA